jgi:glycosyltransferase involved in cell wall biosynthesis
VVHALSLGTPIVSQRLGPDLIGHGPEAYYVRDDLNGRLAADGGAAEFAQALSDVLDNKDRLSAGAIEFAERSLTLDGMIDGFLDAIDYVTASAASP